MIGFIFELSKKVVFAFLVLIGGVIIQWEGRPISEHLLRRSRTLGVQAWVTEHTRSAQALLRDAREGSKLQPLTSRAAGPHREKIKHPERNRLRSLLQKEDGEAER